MNEREEQIQLLRDMAASLHHIEGMLSAMFGAYASGLNAIANNYKGNTRHDRRRSAKGSHTRAEWEALKAFYGYTCVRCGRREPDIKLTRDHVQPIETGGSNDISNIQPLCIACNHGKDGANIDYRPNYRPPAEAQHESNV